MKKLLSMFLVLTMASFASAAIVIEVDDSDLEVRPSQVVEIVVYSDTDITMGNGLLQSILSASNGQAIDWWTEETGWMIAPGGGDMTQYGDPPMYDGFDFLVNNMAGTTPFPAYAVIYSILFHVPEYKQESDYIIIDPTSGTWDGIPADIGDGDGLPYIVLHVVPEPMTVALLGLGGLFLIRRRK
jgi:hypothetical protein